MKESTVQARFVLGSEEISPDFITKKVGIIPCLSGIKGEIVNGKIPYPDSFWEVFTEIETSIDVSDQIRKIMKIIEPSIQNFKDLIEEYKLTPMLSVLIIIENGEVPVLSLSREEIDFFNSLNTDMDFDIYANPYSDPNMK